MSSAGIEKYRKYFMDRGEVQTTVKKDSVVYASPETRSGFSQIPAKEPITVVGYHQPTNRYHVVYSSGEGFIPDAAVAKPNISETHRLTAAQFIEGGDSEVHNGVTVKSFTSAAQLKESIQYGLAKYQSGGIAQTDFFSDMGRVKWGISVIPEEQNKYGCYLGELFIGLLALSGKHQWKAHKFMVPVDPSFNGVDSFVQTADQMIQVSSKYGTGAAASFFGNILPKVQNATGELQKVEESASAVGASPEELSSNKKSKDVCYHYGINHVLGISDINNPLQVFHDIRNNVTSPLVETVVQSIKSKCSDAKILEALPYSTTSYFCRAMAENLQNCPDAMDQMKSILAGKDFWQANLNMKLWRSGTIHYDLTSSKNIELSIIGNKSATNDITCKQGMVNYRIRKAKDSI